MNEQLTALLTRYRMYNSLVSYWQRSHEVHLQFPDRYHLSKSIEYRDESQRKANTYWTQFVDMIRESKRMVSYDPVLCRVMME
jgi:hypothetical protein